MADLVHIIWETKFNVLVKILFPESLIFTWYVLKSSLFYNQANKHSRY